MAYISTELEWCPNLVIQKSKTEKEIMINKLQYGNFEKAKSIISMLAEIENVDNKSRTRE